MALGTVFYVVIVSLFFSWLLMVIFHIFFKKLKKYIYNFILFSRKIGVTECYSFAVMTRNEVDSYNGKLTIMTIIFLAFAWLLSHFFGPLGFIMANGFNFAMRIGHNIFVIKEKHGNGTLDGAKIPRLSFGSVIGLFNWSSL